MKWRNVVTQLIVNAYGTELFSVCLRAFEFNSMRHLRVNEHWFMNSFNRNVEQYVNVYGFNQNYIFHRTYNSVIGLLATSAKLSRPFYLQQRNKCSVQ